MTTLVLPEHTHARGVTHSHANGHTRHSHWDIDSGAAEPRQYDRPTAILWVMRLAGRPIGRTKVRVIVKSYVWDTGYLRYTPAKGFDFHYEDKYHDLHIAERGTNGNITLLAAYHDFVQVEDLDQ